MKCVRRAMRIATGTSNAAASIASPKLAPSRSASGNGHLDRAGHLGRLELDYVLDRVVHAVAPRPAGHGLQQRGVGAAMRDLLEPRLVGDLERDEADL